MDSPASTVRVDESGFQFSGAGKDGDLRQGNANRQDERRATAFQQIQGKRPGLPSHWAEQYSQRGCGGLELRSCWPEEKNEACRSSGKDLQLARYLLTCFRQPAEDGSKGCAPDALFKRP